MAEETLVGPYREFYQAVRKVIEGLHDRHGPLYLACLVWFQDRPANEWTLLVGSRPLLRDLYQGVNAVATTLARQLRSEFSARIKKIGLVPEDDPFFKTLRRGLKVNPIGLVELERCSFNGIEIERGAAFAVTRPPAASILESAAKHADRRGRGPRPPRVRSRGRKPSGKK